MAKKKSKKAEDKEVKPTIEENSGKQIAEIIDAWVDMYVLENIVDRREDLDEELETALRIRLNVMMTQIANVNQPVKPIELLGTPAVSAIDVLDVVGSLIDGKSHVSAILSNTPDYNGDIQLSLNRVQKYSMSRANKRLNSDTVAFKEGATTFNVNSYSLVNWLSYFTNNHNIESFTVTKARNGMDVVVVELEGEKQPVEFRENERVRSTENEIMNDFTFKYLQDILSTGEIIRDIEFHSLLQIFVDAYNPATRSINPCVVQKVAGVWTRPARYSQPDSKITDEQWVNKAELIRTISRWETLLRTHTLVVRPFGHIWGLTLTETKE